jgi:transcriptional antiterminator RfaH
MQNWYLVQTKLGGESVAIENLNNQGFMTYCPMLKIKNKTQALFPRYVFVGIKNEQQDTRPIRSTKGVNNMVRFGSEVARVPQKIIDDIKNQESQTADKIIDFSRFHSGDKVEIMSGVFEGNNAIFSNYDGDSRVILLIKMINQEQKIKVDKKQIKKF